MTKYAPFDAADFLDDEETIVEYLTAALEDSNPDVFLTAVRDVSRALGMTRTRGKDAGLGPESLYKALTPGAKPRYDTVLRLLHALESSSLPCLAFVIELFKQISKAIGVFPPARYDWVRERCHVDS